MPPDFGLTDDPEFWAQTSDRRTEYCAKSPDCYQTYEWNDDLKYAFAYHFFGLLWTNQFIVGWGMVVIAGAIGSYYWARGNSDEMPRMPVVRAIRNATFYHLGECRMGCSLWR